MKTMTKILGAAVLAGGAMIAASAPASAQVSVGIGIGGGYGGYYGPPAYSCDPYSRFYDPYRCGYPAYYGSRYYGPSYYYGGPSIMIGGRFGGYRDGYRGGNRGGGGRHR